MPDGETSYPHAPESRTVRKKQTRLSLVWVVPIIAAVAGAWVAVTRYLSEGPTITIVFDTAEGLEAGKTKVHYNGVEIGTVATIRLSDDHKQVVTTVRMEPKTEDLCVEDTQFWVVRARISGANVTGLGTLISGSYIGMEIGRSSEKKHEFVALTNPPVVAGDTPGRFFVLKTPTLGSLDFGTPLFFRRLKVGEVASYALDGDGSGLSVKVFVNAPYDQFVTPETRFWHASGIDVSLSANGLSVQTQSVLSILVGGIAFDTPAASAVLPPAEADTVFTLFRDRADAFKPPRGKPQRYGLVFTQSVRGLTRDAPVEFHGIPIGDVVDMRPQLDPATAEFTTLVIVDVFPEMLGGNVIDASTPEGAAARRKRLENWTERGLRAQLRTGSILTGSLYVAVDFFPDAPPATVDWSKDPVQLATLPGEFEGIEASIARIVKKIDDMPLKQIGDDLAKSIAQLDRTLKAAETAIDAAGKTVDPSSALLVEVGGTLQEVSRAARSVRTLADYLERHPEALLRGKTGEAK